MSYVKTEWQTGDLITADKINKIEDGIEVISEGYDGLKGDLDDLRTIRNYCLLTKDSKFSQGYLDANGNLVATDNGQRTSDFIELENEKRYVLEYSSDSGTRTYPRMIVIYNSSKVKTGIVSLPSDMTNIILNGDDKYIRVNYFSNSVEYLYLYPYDIGKEDIYSLKENVRVPKAEENEEKINLINETISYINRDTSKIGINYIHSRRPIICFIIDGDYDLNESYEAIFSAHNVRIGFAPQYVNFVSTSIVNKYLSLQSKGHEILSHLTYVMSDSTTYTDEQCNQFIKDSFTTMKNAGLNVVGAIGSGGKVADKFIPIIQKYYDYAATENNHSDTTSITYHKFETSNPYHLWRYSMQMSTLEQMKQAVDNAITNNALLMFYGHAKSDEVYNFTSENLEALLTYIDSKVNSLECTVKTPKEAIYDFYSFRYDDLIN